MPELDYSSLCSVVGLELRYELEHHRGLGVFAGERSKFEGWLKVELVNVLMCRCYDAVPEKDTIDVVCGNAAIELKTINTNYSYEGVTYKHKPITDNVYSIIEDINKLENTAYKLKAVVFVAFPLKHGQEEWQNIHLPKITERVSRMQHDEIIFCNSIPGVIYTCELGKTETHCFDAS